MAIKIQSINESIADNGIKILVHGPAGSGKTVLCATAGAPTILISAESGLLSIKGAIENGLLPKKVNQLVKIVEISNLEDLKEIYETLASEHICEWIALDSISEIAEVVLANEKEFSKDPRQAYGNLITEMTTILKKFRDLPKYNVIMSCKQQRVVDQDTGSTLYLPSLPGSKLSQEIPYLFDEVFCLRVEKDDDGEDYRILQTNRDIRYEAKDRSGKLKLFEEPSLFCIMKKINGEIQDVDSSKDNKNNELHSQEKQEFEKIISDEIISETTQYWYHEPSDKYMITEKDTDISELVNNPDVIEMSKLQYTKKVEAAEKEKIGK